MTSDQHSPPPKPTGLSAFWAELKRRKVMRVAITYAVVAWLIIQIAATTFEGFGIPIWAFRFVMLCVILGFPIAIILAWAFELTPDGIKTTKTAKADRQENMDTVDAAAHSKKRNWLAYAVGALFPTVIFGALALFFYIRSGSLENRLASTEQVEEIEKSIAVLPLKNMSPDPENAFFADGVQEDILTNLARIDELLVIARTSTLQYRDTTKTVGTIGEELGVSYLVEGSVRRAGNRVKITVQLIDCNTGDHLWADDFDRGLDDTFAIQVEVAKKIAGQLQAVFSAKEMAKIEYRPTKNQEAYDYYVKYRQLVDETRDKIEEKAALLETAVSLDPQFAEAQARLAQVYIIWWDRVDHRRDPDLYAKAYRALNEARRLKPVMASLSYAEAMFATYEHNDLETAIEALLETLELDPGFYTALRSLGRRCLRLGRLAEAQRYMEEVFRIAPSAGDTNYYLFLIYKRRGDWEKARNLIHHNLENGTEEGGDWRFNQAIIDYTQTGDKKAFVSAINLATGLEGTDAQMMHIRKALFSRDYNKALQLIDEKKTDGHFYQFFRQEFSLAPLNLLSALIRFELDERDHWLKAAEKAKNYLELVIKSDPNADPNYFSNLAVCYALGGQHKAMESLIQQVRKRTQQTTWQYEFKAHCELHFAITYLVLGDHDKAIEILEAANEMDGPIFLNRELDLWFIFDRLRGNPRFDALLED